MRAVPIALVSFTLVVTATHVQAAFITATLQASPSTINEGEQTTLSLTVNNTPRSGAYGWYYTDSYHRYQDAYSGGYMNYISGALYSGDGSTAGISYSLHTNSFTASRTFTYKSPGDFVATASASVSTSDTFTRYYQYYSSGYFYGGWYDNGTANGSTSSYRVINAGTAVHVNNSAPMISSIVFDAVVTAGESAGFAVQAMDPGGVAAIEAMTFAYDFTGSGIYVPLYSGTSLTNTGSHVFASAGVHRVGIQVTDGLGGTTTGYFDVTVLPSVPEPTSLALAGFAGLGMAIGAWRRRARQQAA